MQLPVRKGKTVTGAFYNNVVFKKFKAKFKRHRPKTGFKCLCLLHDNAPAHKARIVTEFLEPEKVNVLPHHPLSPDLAPCEYFLFPKYQVHLSGERYMSKNALGSAFYPFLMGVPIQDCEQHFKNWIDCLKRRRVF